MLGGALDAVAEWTACHLATLAEPLGRPEQLRLAACGATLRPECSDLVASAIRGSQADFHLVANPVFSTHANPWVELTSHAGRVRVERADLRDDGTYARRVLLDEDIGLAEAVRSALDQTQLWAGQEEVGWDGLGPLAKVWCRDGDRYAAVRFWFITGDRDRAAERFFWWLWGATPGRLRRRARYYRTPVARWFV